MKAKKVVVATPYCDRVNEIEKKFLEDSGFEVLDIRGLGVTNPRAIPKVQIDELYHLTMSMDRSQADAVFISCTGLCFLDYVPELEEELGMPLVTSIQATMWKALRAIGRKDDLGLALNGGESSAEGNTATCWITGRKLSTANAALVNGTMADILDWEDCSWTGHPSASIIPVSWAVAETKKKSGKDLITAIVAAYEAYQRIAMAVQPPEGWDAFKGWGLTSWQLFDGIVSAAKLMGLTSEQINQAYGVGAQCSPIPSGVAHAHVRSLPHRAWHPLPRQRHGSLDGGVRH